MRNGIPSESADPEQIQAVEPHEHAVLVEVLPVHAALLHAEVREHPAHMRMHEPANGAAQAVAVADVR